MLSATPSSQVYVQVFTRNREFASHSDRRSSSTIAKIPPDTSNLNPEKFRCFYTYECTLPIIYESRWKKRSDILLKFISFTLIRSIYATPFIPYSLHTANTRVFVKTSTLNTQNSFNQFVRFSPR